MKESEEGADKAFRAGENAPPPGPGREPSAEERDGMTDTETAPRPPLGVGESINASAEDIARGAEKKAGTKGASDRPYAENPARDYEGVHPTPSVTEDSPDLAPGDQGG